jgi:hypothetical protein
MPKAQSASHDAAGQNIASLAAGTAVPAAAPDAAALARPGVADRPAASATSAMAPATSAMAPATALVAVPAPAAVPARAAVPAPGTAPALPARPARSPTWQANLARLEKLAEVLSHHGLRARLMTPPGGVPSLHVVNPSAAALAEDVYAGRGQDGLWWFWWSWAERITVGEDLEGAASMIEHVLAAG